MTTSKIQDNGTVIDGPSHSERATTNRSHAKRRLRERYDLKVNISDLKIMEQWVQNADPRYVRLQVDKDHPGRIWAAVRWMGQWLMMAYDRPTESFVTAMQSERLTPFLKLLPDTAVLDAMPQPSPRSSILAKVKTTAKTESWTDDPERAAKNAAHLAAMETAESPQVVKAIELPRLDIQTIEIRLVGDSPLICHAWSKKAKQQILDKQMGKATAGKTHKSPEQDFKESLYHLEGGGFGFPTIAFKSAAVSACTSLGKAVTKVMARQAFHVVGEMARIDGTPVMRDDMVRIGMGTADIRFRAEFKTWSVVLTVRYNARVLSDEQIVNLFNTAGFAVGVGEWRSERDGSYGLFHVDIEQVG